MDSGDNLPEVVEEQVPKQHIQVTKPVQVPLYRRDLHPTNLVLSAHDLKEFSELICEANEHAKELEFAQLDLTGFESADHARQRVNELIPVDCDCFTFEPTPGAARIYYKSLSQRQ